MLAYKEWETLVQKDDFFYYINYFYFFFELNFSEAKIVGSAKK